MVFLTAMPSVPSFALPTNSVKLSRILISTRMLTTLSLSVRLSAKESLSKSLSQVLISPSVLVYIFSSSSIWSRPSTWLYSASFGCRRMPRDSLDSILLAYVTYCCSVHCPFNAVLTLYRAYMILLWLKSTKNLKRYVLTEFIVIIPWSVLYLSVQICC
jgi:hypothetical protein